MTTTLNYSYMFEFEKDFPVHVKQKWVEDNWATAVLSTSIIYVILIYIGQKYMKDRPPFDLRGLMTLWNFILASFSIWGTSRLVPEFIYILKTFGLRGTLCLNDYMLRSSISAFCCWMFVLSKVVELGDTLFIILRKQHLIFLHWYHHITAMLGVWYSYATGHSMGRWTIVMNLIVHSFMYTYYFLRAMRFKIPRPIAMSITFMQILQMVIGAIAAIWSYMIYLHEGSCEVTWRNSVLCILVYVTDFLLFLQFFKKSYLKPIKKTQ